jgi:hypothetical protein
MKASKLRCTQPRGKIKMTFREIQSLIGLLNFACCVVVSGRAFLRRLISLTVGGLETTLSNSFKFSSKVGLGRLV